MANFKKELSERNILTEDDITELESHILDKVDDLKQDGLNENDAFDEAVNDLGSVDEIAAEYSKVNFSPSVKFALLCFGYFSISSMMSIIYLITMYFSYSIKNLSAVYEYKHIPIFTPMIEALSYDNHSNYASLFIFLLNTTLMILLLYFISKKKNNVLSILADKFLLIRSSKAPIKFAVSLLIVMMPLLLQLVMSFIFDQLSVNMSFTAIQHNFNCTLLNTALILLLTIRYMKSNTPENTSSYMILGYSIVTIAIRFIPASALNISIAIGQFNIVCISILCIVLFVITCGLIRLISKKGILEHKPNIIFSALLIICYIGSLISHPYTSSLDYTLWNDMLIKFGYMSSAVQFCINLLAAAALFSNHKFLLHRKEA